VQVDDLIGNGLERLWGVATAFVHVPGKATEANEVSDAKTEVCHGKATKLK